MELTRLRAEILPVYEADEVPLSSATIKKIKKLADQEGLKPTQFRSVWRGLAAAKGAYDEYNACACPK